jgi:hypothetical protein
MPMGLCTCASWVALKKVKRWSSRTDASALAGTVELKCDRFLLSQ